MTIEPARQTTSYVLTDDEILMEAIDFVHAENAAARIMPGRAVLSRLNCEEQNDEDAPTSPRDYDPTCQECVDSATGFHELSLEDLGRLACTCDPHPDADCSSDCAVCA